MSAPHMHMMNESGLLECPFCGQLNDVFIYRTKTHGNYRVACGECETESGIHYSNDSAVKAWNTRNGHLYTKADFAEKSWEMQNSDLTGGV